MVAWSTELSNYATLQLSVPQIKATLDSLGESVSQRYIARILKQEGFERLPRRTSAQRQGSLGAAKLDAPKSQPLSYCSQSFAVANSIAALCLLPWLCNTMVSLDWCSSQTTLRLNQCLGLVVYWVLCSLNSPMSVAIVTSDLWCMERGLGLFAGLTVLPKSAWFSSYAHRVSRQMNHQFLQQMTTIWKQHNLLSDTVNLDFTTLPAWGEAEIREKNWSSTRQRQLTSILAALAQDPDSGIISYAARRHDISCWTDRPQGQHSAGWWKRISPNRSSFFISTNSPPQWWLRSILSSLWPDSPIICCACWLGIWWAIPKPVPALKSTNSCFTVGGLSWPILPSTSSWRKSERCRSCWPQWSNFRTVPEIPIKDSRFNFMGIPPLRNCLSTVSKTGTRTVGAVLTSARLAAWTKQLCTSPRQSTTIWRFRPLTCFPPSKPRSEPPWWAILTD